MSVWRNGVEEQAFRETHCARCFQPDEATKRLTGRGEGCPHLAKAAVNRVALPEPWTRRRNAPLGDTFKCTAFLKQPPVNRIVREMADTAALFDEPEPEERLLVPVEGWEDYRARERRQAEGDHQ